MQNLQKYFLLVLGAAALLLPAGARDESPPGVPPIIPMPDLSDPLAPGPVVPLPVKPRPRVLEAEVVDDDPALARPVVPFGGGVAPSPAILEVDVVEALPLQGAVVPGQPVPRERTKVSVLGYHDFSPTKAPTRMRMRTSDFRAEMQRIRNSGATVISLDDYLAWKQGTKQLPAHCILITLDDGWKSVYTDAYPILKEYGYPFTLFLYTNFVNSGGASLSWAMIKEMMKNGATVGSHSVSHPYPSHYRAAKRKGDEAYRAFLKKEMGESKKILDEKLGISVTAFCFPGGYKTEEMFEILAEGGYMAAFDVLAGKSTVETRDMEVPRYMVLGDMPGTFEGALVFRDTATGNGNGAVMFSSAMDGPVPVQVVTPRANSHQSLGLHPISINLAQSGNIDPDSIIMRVSGIGRVPGAYDPVKNAFSWTPNRVLRGKVTVQVSWTMMGSRTRLAPVEWQFSTTEFVQEQPPKGWIP